ncbi:MAG: SDR family oxidoreductase [Novosphingobium sp.]
MESESRLTPLMGLTALVTGCGRRDGIGRAIALELARQGADVAITDLETGAARNLGESEADEVEWLGLESAAAEIEALSRRTLALTGDISSEATAQNLVAEAVEHLGKVDILVNNAGAPHGADRGPSWEIPVAAFDSVMAINARGTFLMCRFAMQHMLRRLHAGEELAGRIVNIASGAGKRGFPDRAAYCASKFAVIGLTQTMAQELGDKSITVNAVCPGAIQTSRATARNARGDAPDPARRGMIAPAVPRPGMPEEIARTVSFLASPNAGYITGQSIMVDGGLLMV